MKLEFKPYTEEVKLLPGMIVKREDNLIELVGHINNKEGYCDCCSYGGEIIEYSDSFFNMISGSIVLYYIDTPLIPLEIAFSFLKEGFQITHDTFESGRFLQKIDEFIFLNQNIKVTRMDDFKRTFKDHIYEAGWKVLKKSTNQDTKETSTAEQSE